MGTQANHESASASGLSSGMPRRNLVRVSLSCHRHMCLRPLRDYFYADSLVMTEVVISELAQATVNFPLGLMVEDGVVKLMALLSLKADCNLFVSDKGTWLADHVPATLCTYPFRYFAPEGKSQAALFADMDSGLLTPHEGAALFTEDGKPSERAKEIVGILRALEKARKATRKTCEQMLRYKLLVPWGEDCGIEPLQKLLRVNEAALGRLPEGAYAALRQSGAMPLIYAQLLSQAMLPRLQALCRMHDAMLSQRSRLLESCFRADHEELDMFHF
jgi:hypothetical protein